MHHTMASALNLLGFNQALSGRSPKQQTHAFITHLWIAGYLDPRLVTKAVEYLHASKPFALPPEEIAELLNTAVARSANGKTLDPELFFDNFAREECFSKADIIDLFAFLSQTAFDRSFGQERDSLQEKPWMHEYASLFVQLADDLDAIKAKAPEAKEHIGVGIMGAATPRVRARINYFISLPKSYLSAWALSGARQLKEGLDEADEMRKIAAFYEIDYQLGGEDNKFLAITETQMVNYYLATLCPNVPIQVVDSEAEQEHWRATAQQSATDIADVMVKKIKSDEFEVPDSGELRFMIIAEQPYLNRMTRQVQRAFNRALAAAEIKDISVVVEGCGNGVKLDAVATRAEHLATLARINSELAATFIERFNDARIQDPSVADRDDKIMLFRHRDETFQALMKHDPEPQAGSSNRHVNC